MSSESLLIVTISRSLLSRFPVSPAIEPESLFYELGGGGVTRGYSFQMILNGYSLFSPLYPVYCKIMPLPRLNWPSFYRTLELLLDTELGTGMTSAHSLLVTQLCSLISTQQRALQTKCAVLAAFNKCCSLQIMNHPGEIVCLHSIPWPETRYIFLAHT